MPLYTFFLEYTGGTYISQVSARSSALAMEIWAGKLIEMKVPGLGARLKKDLVEKILGEPPTALDGLKNIWCSSALVRGHLALVHFTQTDGRLIFRGNDKSLVVVD
jgi:hypothetical protein